MLVAAPASAAEITDVADAADTILYGGVEREDMFDLYTGAEFSFEWISGRITREPNRQGQSVGCTEATPTQCQPVTELNYKRRIQLVDLKTQIGLFQDLALTIDLPIYFGDTIEFDYADGVTAATSTIDGTSGKLFDRNFSSKRAGLGKLQLGLLFGALNDERDDTKPSWVMGVSWHMPYTAGVYEPGVSPVGTKNAPARIGDGVHRIVFKTALSRRIGNFGLIGIDDSADRRGYTDPYLELSYSLPVAQQTGTPAPLDPKNSFGTLPSHIARIKAGVEVVPYERISKNQKVAVDLGLRAAFYSEGRDYTLVSDALGEFNYTEQFFQVGGILGIYAQPFEFMRFRLAYTLLYGTERFITYENVGRDNSAEGTPGYGQVLPNTEDELNPYYCGYNATDKCTMSDSYDQVGRRLKAEANVHHRVTIAMDFTF